MYKDWQLAMIDEAGYNGIREEHIEKVADSILSSGLDSINGEDFGYYCRKCNIDADNFTQLDLERLQRALNK